MQFHIQCHAAPLKQAFNIARGAKTEAETIRVTLADGKHAGRGECVPYRRYGETIDTVLAALEAARPTIEAGINRDNLQTLMGPGAARCAVDCALWDLEAKQTKTPVWKLAELPEPAPIKTAISISLDTPDKMGDAAHILDGDLIKLKLGGADDLARVEAVHRARPEAKLILDGNEGIKPDIFLELSNKAFTFGAVLLEQPFPADQDDALLKHCSLVSICADESAHTAGDIERLTRKYDAVNIKLDKAGGLTAGIEMVHEARRAGMEVMVGCMVAGSLSMAPACGS
ncbi:MAG: dipeptide epimerase, partial [Pseudomonadota bacterium]